MRRGRKLKKVGAGLLILCLTLEVLDRCFPLLVPGRDSRYATVVVARNGVPSRATTTVAYRESRPGTGRGKHRSNTSSVRHRISSPAPTFFNLRPLRIDNC